MRKSFHLFSLFFFGAFTLPNVSKSKEITFSTADEFILDTPVTTPYERVSLDFHSAFTQTKKGSTTNSPSLMATVGLYPDVQLFAVVPATLSTPKKGPTHYGYGDVRLGLKYRFIHETETLPSVAFYPKFTFPSGDSRKGLGNGTWIGKFPLW